MPFEGLAPARNTGGPRVVFDLSHKPLPEIPFPSDVATRPDPTSRTGLRINASLIAPTQLERNVRGLLDTLDGFGTFAPMTVAFDQDLDVLDLYNRQNNADLADDGVYLVDLKDGTTTALDFNGGHFPYTLNDPGQYFLNDPNSGVYNLLFPLSNVLHPELPHGTVREQADDLLTFYERETRTLILRPIVPLRQESKYAIVLTNRVHGRDGRAIESPHSGVNHAAQTAELQPLLSHLPPGVGVEDIAYTWAFTTQSTTRDLELIRNGLHASGPLQTLSYSYRVKDITTSTDYSSRFGVLPERGPYPPPADATNVPANYILPISDCAAPPAPPACLTALLNDPQVRSLLIGTDQAEVDALLDTFKYVDYFVSGEFNSPSFLDTDSGVPADQSFQIDERSGAARTIGETVTFLLAVPRQRPEVGHVAPFPTVIAGHGYKSTRVEHILGFGGTFAKFGLATIAIDAYGHGIGIDPLLELTARTLAHTYGLDAFAAAVFQGRARDLDYDGILDSGGDFWTADTFHTRDVVRQSIVDWMQLVRLLRSFDGTGVQLIGNAVNKAGDFNNDGIPDVAGLPAWPNTVFAPDHKTHLFEKGGVNPGSDLFAFGISLGGILTGILPAVEPAIVAAGPTSGAGGLADVGIRSTLDQVVQAVFLELFGPMFATCPFSASSGPPDPQTGIPFGACNAGAADAQPMLVLVVQDVNRERDVPVAQLTLQPGQRVMVRNLAQTTADCSNGAKIDGCSIGTADAAGRLRLPIAADWPTLSATVTDRGPGVVPRVKTTVMAPGDPLQVTVFPVAGGEARVIDKYEVEARFFGIDYKPQTPLTSPARGYGLSRNTPEFRRMMGLSQLILEPGDPVNYAPHYFKDLLPSRATPQDDTGRVAGPANVLVIGTSGDPGVPINTAISLARAAGIVDTTHVDPAFGMTIDQVLIKSGVVEGVPATARFGDPNAGVFAALPGHVRCDPGSICTGDVLIDPTGYSCDEHGASCLDGLAAPRLDPPLRQQLTVMSSGPTGCPVSTRATGSGCWSTGASACAAGANGVSALLIPYLNRTGQHGFFNPQPGKPFDMDQFMANVVGRFFECRGRELHFEQCQQDLASCPWIPLPP
ncbi:MAG: hypothetical protein ABR567_13730 [Myxococcales bacterium]